MESNINQKPAKGLGNAGGEPTQEERILVCDKPTRKEKLSYLDSNRSCSKTVWSKICTWFGHPRRSKVGMWDAGLSHLFWKAPLAISPSGGLLRNRTQCQSVTGLLSDGCVGPPCGLPWWSVWFAWLPSKLSWQTRGPLWSGIWGMPEEDILHLGIAFSAASNSHL